MVKNNGNSSNETLSCVCFVWAVEWNSWSIKCSSSEISNCHVTSITMGNRLFSVLLNYFSGLPYAYIPTQLVATFHCCVFFYAFLKLFILIALCSIIVQKFESYGFSLCNVFHTMDWLCLKIYLHLKFPIF